MLKICDSKGVAERGSRTKGGRGGGPAEGRKKKATLRILMAEAVSDMPEGLRMVLLEFKTCPSRYCSYFAQNEKPF
jgi:hypothetical protein